MKCRSCALGSPGSKTNPERNPPASAPRRRGLAPSSSLAQPWVDETSDFPACPWPLPSLHSSTAPLSSRALPPGSNSFLPLSQTEANRMRGQDFGIHQCLRETLAWSPCISCQSCQQPHRRSSLGARLAGSLPAGSTGPPAGASPARRDRTGPRPGPPGPHPPRFTKINTIPAVS